MAETRRTLRALGRIAFAGGILALGTSPARGATFTVTSAVDAADIGVGDGLCSAIVGMVPGDPLPLFVFGCTLRAALQEANFAPGADTIIVPAGSFGVELAVTAVDDAGGDLDVTDDVAITGAGSASTILDASALPAGQPALAITDPAPADGNPVELLLAGVTIADAPAEGLLSETTTHFELEDVVIRGSGSYGIRKNGVGLDPITDSRIAESTSAGLFSVWGDLEIANSIVENNGGGGILNLRGALTVTDSTIRGNTGSDGGIRQQGTSLHVVRTTIHDNHSTSRGGGLSIQGGGPNVIRDTTFSANSTTSDGGAISAYAPLSISNSTLSGNQANGDGGGVFASGSPAIVRIDNPRWTSENRPYGDISKAAIGRRPGRSLFYRVAASLCKLGCVRARQLFGPHLRMWPWWRSRSSMAVTAAVSPSKRPQSSTGRFEVRSVLVRS